MGPKGSVPLEERSIEELEEASRRRLARDEEDDEAALEELEEGLRRLLVESIGTDPAGETTGEPEVEPVRQDEFVCSCCHLVFVKARLGDRLSGTCIDCTPAREAERPGERVGFRAIGGTLRAVCPACGEPVLVPDRHEGPNVLSCPTCKALVERRGGHLHLVWDHRAVRDHPLVRWPDSPAKAS